MAKVYKICKICGKEYEYCKTKSDGQFRWMDVACCPEHASEYFAQIAISRGETPEEDTVPKKKGKTFIANPIEAESKNPAE